MVNLVEKQCILVHAIKNNSSIIEDKFGFVLQQFREELDDHRDAINENTVELQSNYELFRELNSRIEKLSERFDELYLLVKGKREPQKFIISPLTQKEKTVFSALYSATQNGVSASYMQIARMVSFPEQLVSSYVASMLEKGVPIVKTFSGGTVFLFLDADFRQEQTKKNILDIETPLTYWQVQ